MSSLFRPPLSEEAEGLSVSNEEHAGKPAIESPDGLISATELPSATDVLADLFREDSPALPIEQSHRTPSREEAPATTVADKTSEPTPSMPSATQSETVAPDETFPGTEVIGMQESFSEEIVAAAIESAQQAVDEIAKAEVSAIAHGQDVSRPQPHR